MSEAIKPTPGVWRAEKENIHAGAVATCHWDGGPWWEVWSDGWMDGGSAEANARLIAEAGTVHHETGLTPRQLVNRVKELEEALKLAEAGLADIGDADREPGDDLAWCERRAAEPLPRIRAALSKSLPNTVAEVK